MFTVYTLHYPNMCHHLNIMVLINNIIDADIIQPCSFVFINNRVYVIFSDRIIYIVVTTTEVTSLENETTSLTSSVTLRTSA